MTPNERKMLMCIAQIVAEGTGRVVLLETLEKMRREDAASAPAGEAESMTAAMRRDYNEGFAYLLRLFRRLAPQCHPVPSLTGLATQIDNYIVGLRSRLDREASAPAGDHFQKRIEAELRADRAEAQLATAAPAGELKELIDPHKYESEALAIVKAIKDQFLPAMDENDGGEILLAIMNLIRTARMSASAPAGEATPAELEAAERVLDDDPDCRTPPRLQAGLAARLTMYTKAVNSTIRALIEQADASAPAGEATPPAIWGLVNRLESAAWSRSLEQIKAARKAVESCLGKRPHTAWATPQHPPEKTTYRKDGWPLCPQCQEDELMSVQIPAKATDDLHCLSCNWRGRVPELRTVRADFLDHVTCEDCGKPYGDFAIDVSLSAEDWARLDCRSVLCGACIVNRAARLKDVIVVTAHLRTKDEYKTAAEDEPVLSADVSAEIERLAKSAVSGRDSEGQVEFNIEELVKCAIKGVRDLFARHVQQCPPMRTHHLRSSDGRYQARGSWECAGIYIDGDEGTTPVISFRNGVQPNALEQAKDVSALINAAVLNQCAHELETALAARETDWLRAREAQWKRENPMGSTIIETRPVK